MILVISDLHLEERRGLPDPLLDRLFDMIESVCKRAACRKVRSITFVLLGDPGMSQECALVKRGTALGPGAAW